MRKKILSITVIAICLVINAYNIQVQGMDSIKEDINTCYDKTVIK